MFEWPLPPGFFSGPVPVPSPKTKYRSKDSGAIYEGEQRPDGFWVNKIAQGVVVGGPPLGFWFRWGHEPDCLDVVDFQPEALVSFPYCGDPGDEHKEARTSNPMLRDRLQPLVESWTESKTQAEHLAELPGLTAYRKHYCDGYAKALGEAINRVNLLLSITS